MKKEMEKIIILAFPFLRGEPKTMDEIIKDVGVSLKSDYIFIQYGTREKIPEITKAVSKVLYPVYCKSTTIKCENQLRKASSVS